MTLQDRFLDWFKNGFTNNSVKTRQQGAVSLADYNDSNQPEIAIGSGSTLVLGDMTIYGIPYTNITLTKTGANAVATVTWAVSSGGFLVIDITMNATDSIAITADNLNGDTFTNPIMYVDASDGVTKNAALTGATAETISIWVGK